MWIFILKDKYFGYQFRVILLLEFHPIFSITEPNCGELLDTGNTTFRICAVTKICVWNAQQILFSPICDNVGFVSDDLAGWADPGLHHQPRILIDAFSNLIVIVIIVHFCSNNLPVVWRMAAAVPPASNRFVGRPVISHTVTSGLFNLQQNVDPFKMKS